MMQILTNVLKSEANLLCKAGSFLDCDRDVLVVGDPSRVEAKTKMA